MALKDFLARIDDEVATVNASDFNIEIYDTEVVPSFDDSYITFENLDNKIKRCKRLKSCALYVDIRNSASISASKKAWTLARIYSSFVRSMIAAASYYGGHVRNIIGDRVMVVFDAENCFTNAVKTAVLMNTIAHYIIKKHVNAIDFKCGIGIDYGTMLVTKAGAIKRNDQTEFYRALVWLGRPANIASRLTDVANKTITKFYPTIHEAHNYPHLSKLQWYEFPESTFIDRLEKTYSRNIRHQSEYFYSFFKAKITPCKNLSLFWSLKKYMTALSEKTLTIQELSKKRGGTSSIRTYLNTVATFLVLLRTFLMLKRYE